MSTRLVALCAIVPLLLLASCDGSPVAEFDPPEEPEEEVLEVELDVSTTPDTVQGILSPVIVRVTVRTLDGEPVPDHEVTLTVVEGPGAEVGSHQAASLCWLCRMNMFRDNGETYSGYTGADGRMFAAWLLGATVGEQVIEITATGAVPVRRRIDAVPGIILVGVWNLSDEEEQARLPSDTIRVHASNYHPSHHNALGRFFEEMDDGRTRWINGTTVRGSGFDPAWDFHFHPRMAHPSLPYGDFPGRCWWSPFVLENDYWFTIMEDQWSTWGVCGGRIRFVGIEEVPQSYLDVLAAR